MEWNVKYKMEWNMECTPKDNNYVITQDLLLPTNYNNMH